MSDPLVLVTGASGYIAAHVVKVLQEAGYRVRGTVRSLENKEKVGELENICPEAKHPLELVEADLLKPESWPQAVKDCTYVLHTASPVIITTTAKDPEKELIAPAVEGTRTILQCCLQEDSVKRVVLTSSCSAVFSSSQPEKDVYTEEDWTDENSNTISQYARSKTLAEKEAWKIVKENPGKFELSVINPVLVFGPILTSGVRDSECVKIIKGLVQRELPMLPHLYCQICDVRDVAEAHLKALTEPDAAGHRHLIHSDCMFYADIGKMQEVLKIKPRPMDKSVTDMAYSLIDKEIIKPTDKYKNRNKE